MSSIFFISTLTSKNRTKGVPAPSAHPTAVLRSPIPRKAAKQFQSCYTPL